MEPVKVAALQMTSAADVAVNLAAAARLLAEARAAGARVAVLPENFSFMGLRDVDKRAIAEADGDGPVQHFLSQQARELGLWIVGGTTPIAQEPGGRVAAACLVYADDGRRVARYDKMHLFDVDIPGRSESYRESNNIAPGSRAVLVPTPAGLLGLSVCYDMRFPELYRQLSAAGAQWFCSAVGLYRADRTRALGDAAARPGDREPRLRGGTGAVGTPRQRPRDLRRQPDRGLLGRGAVAPWQRRRSGDRRAGPGGAGGGAAQFSRLDASAVVSVNSTAHGRFHPPP